MPKQTTNEELAAMIQRGFESVATKKDLAELATKDDLHAVEERLTRQIDGLDQKLSAHVSSWSRDFDRLHERVEEPNERVRFLEEKPHSKG